MLPLPSVPERLSTGSKETGSISWAAMTVMVPAASTCPPMVASTVGSTLARTSLIPDASPKERVKLTTLADATWSVPEYTPTLPVELITEPSPMKASTVGVKSMKAKLMLIAPPTPIASASVVIDAEISERALMVMSPTVPEPVPMLASAPMPAYTASTLEVGLPTSTSLNEAPAATAPTSAPKVLVSKVWLPVAPMEMLAALFTTTLLARNACEVLLSLTMDTAAPRPTKPPPKAKLSWLTFSTRDELILIWPPAVSVPPADARALFAILSTPMPAPMPPNPVPPPPTSKVALVVSRATTSMAPPACTVAPG